jgi:hypothetical protein
MPGALTGNYAGGTASATVGVGVGANALIGGSTNTVALQPLSIEGNTGLNVAAGIAGVTLTPRRNSVNQYRRHGDDRTWLTVPPTLRRI